VTETYIYNNAFTSNIPWLAASAATVLLIAFTALAAIVLLVRQRLARGKAA
jgi:ABC-type spermidine/putrescine transport system permease subunit I